MMREISLELTNGDPRARRRSQWHYWLQQMLQISGAMLREWRQRHRSRCDLAQLDDRMLRDIGINRVDVWREVNKPFWRA